MHATKRSNTSDKAHYVGDAQPMPAIIPSEQNPSTPEHAEILPLSFHFRVGFSW